MDLFAAMKERRSCRNFLPSRWMRRRLERFSKRRLGHPLHSTVNLGNSLSSLTKKLKKRSLLKGKDLENGLLKKAVGSGWGPTRSTFYDRPLSSSRWSEILKRVASICLQKKARWAIKQPAQPPFKTCTLLPMRWVLAACGSPYLIRRL